MFTPAYLREHFRRVAVPGALTLIALSFVPPSVRFDSKESKVERTGHLTEVHFTPADDPENSYENVYTLQFREFSHGFRVTHLSPGDQYLLTSAEKPDTLFTFAYEIAEEKRAGAYGKIPLLELRSDRNVYLAPDRTGDLMKKSRYLALFLLIASTLAAAKQWRSTRQHLRSIREEEAKAAAAKAGADAEDRAKGVAPTPPAESEEEPATPLVFDPWLTAFAIRPQAGLATIGVLLMYLTWSFLPSPYWKWSVAILAALTVFGIAITQILIERWHKWAPIVPILESHQKKVALAPPRPTTSAPKHVKAVELLLKHGGNLNAANEKGVTALHIAAKLGSTETIALLVKSGATVDVMDENGQTPLHYAVVGQRIPAVQQLVGLGASVLLADNDGEDALAMASKNKKAKNTVLKDYLAEEVPKAKKREEERKKKEAEEKAKAEAEAAAKAAAGGGGTPPPPAPPV